MIKIENVYKRYGVSQMAVNNLSLEIKSGGVCAFIGHNGAGKTTTLKMLTGILRPSKGNIFIEGKKFISDNIELKRSIAYVPDKPMALLELTGREYLHFVLDVYKVDYQSANVTLDDLVNRLRMKNDLDKKIESYSHGMRKKILLIGAFISNAKIIILDEPLTGLDPEAIFIVKEIIKDYADMGNTVIFSTHLLDIAQEICTDFVILNKGELKFKGTYKDMCEEFGKNKNIEKIFMEIIKDEGC